MKGNHLSVVSAELEAATHAWRVETQALEQLEGELSEIGGYGSPHAHEADLRRLDIARSRRDRRFAELNEIRERYRDASTQRIQDSARVAAWTSAAAALAAAVAALIQLLKIGFRISGLAPKGRREQGRGSAIRFRRAEEAL